MAKHAHRRNWSRSLILQLHRPKFPILNYIMLSSLRQAVERGPRPRRDRISIFDPLRLLVPPTPDGPRQGGLSVRRLVHGTRWRQRSYHRHPVHIGYQTVCALGQGLRQTDKNRGVTPSLTNSDREHSSKRSIGL